MRPTEEQQAILDSTGAVTKVIALAGTGKTASLGMLTRQLADRRVLYLAFNRSAADEAKTRFGGRVHARTTHSLAFRDFGSRYKHKLGRMRAIEAAEAAGSAFRQDNHRFRHGYLLLATIDAFLHSGDPEMTAEHLPSDLKGEVDDFDRAFEPRWVVRDAQKLWARMCDPDDSTPMPHDGYLKLWSLSAPRLPYDVILLDEAQDTNPAVFAALWRQTHARRVLVGDPHQAIYGWRGAVDAMGVPADETLYLTGSFRFGPEIAEWGNTVLDWMDPDMPSLRGLGDGSASPVGGLSPDAPLIVARTNAGLLDRMIELYQKHGNRFRPAFVGGARSYAFDTIRSVYDLYMGDRPKDPFLCRFPGFEDLKGYVENARDVDLGARVAVVGKHKRKIPGLLAALERLEVPLDRATHAATTGHRAKGLQAARVEMVDDFIETVERDDQDRPKRIVPFGERVREHGDTVGVREEGNLLYVTATRAITSLCPNMDLALHRVMLEGVPDSGEEDEPSAEAVGQR